jgi:hypothetical protein
MIELEARSIFDTVLDLIEKIEEVDNVNKIIKLLVAR